MVLKKVFDSIRVDDLRECRQKENQRLYCIFHWQPNRSMQAVQVYIINLRSLASYAI